MFIELKEGFQPNVSQGGDLLPDWLQEAFDARWTGSGYNGPVYAAVVSDWKDVTLWGTSFAVRAARGREQEFSFSELGLSPNQLRDEIRELNARWGNNDQITVRSWMDGSVLKVKIDFKTVNITSIGHRKGDKKLGRKAYVVVGNHRRAGLFPFGGILDIPDLFAHAKREIWEEAGLMANNTLRIVGVVPDKKAINFVGVFDIPTRNKCRRFFNRRYDPDQEMTSLIFIANNPLAFKSG